MEISSKHLVNRDVVCIEMDKDEDSFELSFPKKNGRKIPHIKFIWIPGEKRDRMLLIQLLNLMRAGDHKLDELLKEGAYQKVLEI